MEARDLDLDQLVAALNRGSCPAEAPAPDPAGSGLDPLLAHAARVGASDLLIVAGAPPVLRLRGRLAPLPRAPLGPEDTRNLLRRGEDHMLYSALSTGRAEGMVTMEQSLAELVRSGRITRETALAHSFRHEDLKRYL